MMDNITKQEFQNSLDLTSEELENYIPDLLNGLWELGSMPQYFVELTARNNLGKGKRIIDLGCGKGAVLIELAQQFDIKGVGVDIFPDFIKEANIFANRFSVSEKVEFKTEDILEAIRTKAKFDIIIYGYDSEILGNLANSLSELTNCLKEDGHIMLEFMFAGKPTKDMVTDKEMISIINKAGYHILDRIDWNRETLKQTNSRNTEIIKENVKRLVTQNPSKEEIFNEYLQNQIDECEELENDFFCATILLKNKNYC
ncbi:MAG: methyltransferase domain-containing protein [Fulvivirga sp.]